MPSALTYPGVYIEELPSGVRTITGVPTSLTAFVGRAWRGPLDEPVKVNSYSDYERTFGGLWRGSTMSYAVQQFFANGGSQALIVRVATRTGGGAAASATIDLGGGTTLAAAFGAVGTSAEFLPLLIAQLEQASGRDGFDDDVAAIALCRE